MSVGPLCIPICIPIQQGNTYRKEKLISCGKSPRQIFSALALCFLQPFCCDEIMIIDLFLVALLSFVCFVLIDSSSLVPQLKAECRRSDGEQSLEWQTPAVTYPFGSLHNLCCCCCHPFQRTSAVLFLWTPSLNDYLSKGGKKGCLEHATPPVVTNLGHATGCS